jgi:hypothetical protein
MDKYPSICVLFSCVCTWETQEFLPKGFTVAEFFENRNRADGVISECLRKKWINRKIRIQCLFDNSRGKSILYNPSGAPEKEESSVSLISFLLHKRAPQSTAAVSRSACDAGEVGCGGEVPVQFY